MREVCECSYMFQGRYIHIDNGRGRGVGRELWTCKRRGEADLGGRRAGRLVEAGRTSWSSSETDLRVRRSWWLLGAACYELRVWSSGYHLRPTGGAAGCAMPA